MIHHSFSGYVSNKSLFIIGLKKKTNPQTPQQYVAADLEQLFPRHTRCLNNKLDDAKMYKPQYYFLCHGKGVVLLVGKSTRDSLFYSKT